MLQTLTSNIIYRLNYKKIIKQALKEDCYKKDITTVLIAPKARIATAKIIAKQDGILCGIDIAKAVFNFCNKKIEFTNFKTDGEFFHKREVIAEIKGAAYSILIAERTALNFLQHLSGIATYTAKLCKLVDVKISDTRKTTPGLRLLEKYAVKIGGGLNHRMNLRDGVLIKENHIKVAGSISEAINRILRKKPAGLKIEVEAKNINEVKEILKFPVDIIMLDNFNLNDIRKAVRIINKKCLVEVSGNVTEKNIKNIAKTGIDFISIGAITHSAKSIDFSLLVEY